METCRFQAVYMNSKETRRVKTVLRKNKVQGLHYPILRMIIKLR